MTLKQVYYTSSRTGLRHTSGFQINAASPGLDEATLSTIERYSGYQPPSRLAYDHTAPLSDFPTTLSYYRLPDGAEVVARSVYLGAGTGEARGGNFFTHSLVSCDGSQGLGSLLPVQFWAGDFWVSRESSEVDLPDLPLPSPNPGMTLAAAIALVRASERRLNSFEQLLTAVLDGLKSGRRVVLVYSPEECAAWIAAVTLALPQALAHAVSFSTYVRDLQRSEHLIVGVDGSDYERWTTQQLQYDWYIFDEQRGVQSSVTANSDYARFATGVYRRGTPDGLEAFLRFCDELHTPPTAELLDDLLIVHQLLTTREGGREAILCAAAVLPRLIDEPQKVVQPILTQLAGLNARDAAVAAAVWRVWEAARGSVHPTSGQVLTWFVHWLGKQWLAGATAGEIGQFSSTLAATGQILPQPGILATAIISEILATEEGDAERLLALLELAARLGLAKQTAIARRDALETLATRHANVGRVRDIFRLALVARDSDAEEVLYRTLLQRLRDESAFANWIPVLREQPVVEAMLERCRRESCLPLYIRLIGLVTFPDEGRGQRLARLVTQVNADFQYFQQIPQEELFSQFEREHIAPHYSGEALPIAETGALAQVPNIAPYILYTRLYVRVAEGLLLAPALFDDHYRSLVTRVLTWVDEEATIVEGVKNDLLRGGSEVEHANAAYAGGRLAAIQVNPVTDLLREVMHAHTYTRKELPPLVSLLENYQLMRRQLLQVGLDNAIRSSPETPPERQRGAYGAAGNPADRDLFDVAELKDYFQLMISFETDLWLALGEAITVYANYGVNGAWFAQFFRALASIEVGQHSVLDMVREPMETLWRSMSREDQDVADARLSQQAATARIWQSWRPGRSLWSRLTRGR